MIDRAIRTAFRGAHLLLRSYWFVRRPATSGALAAIWHGDRFLLVKNSYRRHHTLPGGYVRPGEDPRAAAARELREETRIVVEPERFTHAYHGTKDFEFRKDTLDIYEAALEEAPRPEVDRREVVWAGFVTPAEARARLIVPHLIEYLDAREAAK